MTQCRMWTTPPTEPGNYLAYHDSKIAHGWVYWGVAQWGDEILQDNWRHYQPSKWLGPLPDGNALWEMIQKAQEAS